MLTGVVADMDPARGLGRIQAADGVGYLFHVIEIADGTRTIDHGAPVVFEPLARFGRFQAGRIQKV